MPPPRQVVLASANRGKQREFAALLGGARAWTLLLQDSLGIAGSVAETGTTFEANALLKARHAAARSAAAGAGRRFGPRGRCARWPSRRVLGALCGEPRPATPTTMPNCSAELLWRVTFGRAERRVIAVCWHWCAGRIRCLAAAGDRSPGRDRSRSSRPASCRVWLRSAVHSRRVSSQRAAELPTELKNPPESPRQGCRRELPAASCHEQAAAGEREPASAPGPVRAAAPVAVRAFPLVRAQMPVLRLQFAHAARRSA